ncbi:MAG: DEAD/DEAH box helicase [Bacteroidota bacterium]
MKFEDYHIEPAIKRSLATLQFRRPTDIQYKAIPHILKGEDVLAIAQTGTGKTAAFAIPIINLLQRTKSSRRSDGIKCVVMVPTHELAIQIAEVFQQIGKHTLVKSLGLFGGVEQEPQIAQLNKGIDVLIATPGRLFDLRSQGHLHLDRVEVLVLDEADHMLDLGFLKDIQDLRRHLPRQRQTLFFSATIDEKIKKLAYSLVSKPIRIQISPKDPVAKNIDHAVAFVEMDDKRFFLERIVKAQPGKKILVFVRTKVRAERVHKAMARVDIPSLTLHGDKDQKKRMSTMQEFKQGQVKLLIATDVSARGIDIPQVEYVINYDLPEVVENYVHRVGRTGRGKHRGQAISFCSSGEKAHLEAIESYLDKPIARWHIDKETYTETLTSSQESHSDWKTLMRKAEEEDQAYKARKRKKKR